MNAYFSRCRPSKPNIRARVWSPRRNDRGNKIRPVIPSNAYLNNFSGPSFGGTPVVVVVGGFRVGVGKKYNDNNNNNTIYIYTRACVYGPPVYEKQPAESDQFGRRRVRDVYECVVIVVYYFFFFPGTRAKSRPRTIHIHTYVRSRYYCRRHDNSVAVLCVARTDIVNTRRRLSGQRTHFTGARETGTALSRIREIPRFQNSEQRGGGGQLAEDMT